MKKTKLSIFQIKWVTAIICLSIFSAILMSSSHREAPMIADDRVADNTDVYAFRNPLHPNRIVIIANYIPGQLPQDGPNYHHFSEDVRYEIHVDNNLATPGDDIIYRFTFKRVNQNPNTFFGIRRAFNPALQGNENLRTTYTLERSMDGGQSFQTVLTDGTVPPPNIGPRSLTGELGLSGPNYSDRMLAARRTASTGERVFAGTIEDPFFVDLGGIFDIADAPRQSGRSVDGLKCINASTIALDIDISILQKNHQNVFQAKNILDPDYVIGVWASASRRKIKTLNGDGTHSTSGEWVQISRLGMPLTNEAIIPIGYKDYWNSLTPYQEATLGVFSKYFYNPELALFMKDGFIGDRVPAFSPLRIQRNSLGQFDFANGKNGLFALKGSSALAGTAFDDAIFGNVLLPAPGSPRSVDLWPIFHTGVPNLAPYQLATGKGGNPLAKGKPFINNFLPNGGDMLRLNMAVPVTPRDHPDFNSLGLIQAAVLGLTDPRFNVSADLQFIPNMDGFPNGRRLEDDVTRIELQAVGGMVLAALGLWYDDFDGTNPVTQDLLNVYTYTTGVEKNDTTFKTEFPFVQTPWPGTHICDCDEDKMTEKPTMGSFPVTQRSTLGVSAPEVIASSSPNPVVANSTLQYKVDAPSQITITVVDASGKAMKVLANKRQDAGSYTIQWNAASLTKGSYFISVSKNGVVKQTLPLVKAE